MEAAGWLGGDEWARDMSKGRLRSQEEKARPATKPEGKAVAEHGVSQGGCRGKACF